MNGYVPNVKFGGIENARWERPQTELGAHSVKNYLTVSGMWLLLLFLKEQGGQELIRKQVLIKEEALMWLIKNYKGGLKKEWSQDGSTMQNLLPLKSCWINVMHLAPNNYNKG